MNRELVGEPGVSPFLQSICQNLVDISRTYPANTAPIYYDPSQDLKNMKEKFASFQDLLVDGEARRFDEKSVDDWMDDIKHLLYDVEDIIDDVKSLTNNHQVCIDELYITFDELKKRLMEILVRTDVIVVRAKDLELKRGSGYALWGNFQAIRRRPETSAIVEMSEIHGREEDQRVIVERLLVANEKVKRNYDVLCIVGMGGLGKTTLAQLVFNDQEVENHFAVKSWVCISDVFDLARATKELIENSDGGGSPGEQPLSALQRRLKEMVGNKRFLFVLDDVWSSTEWEKMKAPFSSCAKGSKILVTTRNINIANALGNKEPYELQELDHDQCMAIFQDKAFGDDEEEQEKLNLGEKIVRACGGVPLVVKVIGSLLQGAEEEKWRAVSEKAALWDAAYKESDEIHPAIRLSYHYLPAFLKRCFEYLAIFPPDYEFEVDDVVRLWIADGLVQDVDGRLAEDIGNEYYNELKARSLIQKNDRMHDIVQHLASDVFRKFCYKENSKEPFSSVRHAFLVNRKEIHIKFVAEAPFLRTLILKDVLQNTIGPSKILRTFKIYSSLGESFIDHLNHLRFLTIGRSDVRHLPDSLCMLGNLQFLDLPWNEHLENLPEKMNGLSNLRFLDVRGSSILNLPDSICALSQLQVLNLSYCGRLLQLPKDIGNLKSLRILDLLDSSMLTVPESIINLTRLQKLRIDQQHLPLHMGRLTRLEAMDVYHVGMEEGRRLVELNLMNKLGGELTIKNMENIIGVDDAKMADLKSKRNIRELTLRWSQPGNDEETEVRIMEALEPHHALRSLYIFNYGGNKLPMWFMSSNICLSNLTWLHMEGLNKICEMENMKLVSLERLYIINCPKLRKVLMATPKLKRLYILKCRELEAASMHLLPSLSDRADMHSIVSHLIDLQCAFNIFEYFFEKIKTANSKWNHLKDIRLNARGTRAPSLPAGWPSMMDCIQIMHIGDIGPGKFQFLPDGDQSDFPPSLSSLKINRCRIDERLPHHSYTITMDGKVEREEGSTSHI